MSDTIHDKITNRLQVQVLEKTAIHFKAAMTFSLDTGFFAGHFPELPLLPGVVQAHVAIRLFEKHLERKLNFRGFKNMKFFNPIFPGTLATLECDLDVNKKQLSFHYFQGENTYSKGVMVLGDV